MAIPIRTAKPPRFKETAVLIVLSAQMQIEIGISKSVISQTNRQFGDLILLTFTFNFYLHGKLEKPTR